MEIYMAYTFFPTTAAEIQKTLKGDKLRVSEIISVFGTLKQMFPKEATPINIDPLKISKINVTRRLAGEVDLRQLKNTAKALRITMKFGEGSSGNRGAKNQGNAFEKIFATAIEKWWAGDDQEIKLAKAVEDVADIYGLKELKELKVEVEVKTVGELNNRRPIVYSPKILISSKMPIRDNNLGPVVSDVTLISQKKEYYLSLKTSGTVTFFNAGIKSVFLTSEIKSGKISNDNGIKLLDMFNIKNELFCDIYNGNLKQGYSEDVWQTMDSKQKANLKDFLKSGIGHGYTIVHKIGGSIKVYEIDKKYMDKAATPLSCTVYYGGKTGTGKRIDMEIETQKYILKVNIRDTQGKDGYPSRIMCDYSYK
jgi:hypothetical protein